MRFGCNNRRVGAPKRFISHVRPKSDGLTMFLLFMLGDGLILSGRQVFTQLTGFPASPHGGGRNRLPRLIVDGIEVVHIEAPGRIAELTEHINRLVPDWIP